MKKFIEFKDLPRLALKHREPFLVVERATIQVDDGGLVAISEAGRTQIPVGGVACLMLQPGVTITHDAVKLCGKTQTLVLWVSENGTRLYAAGSTGHGPAEHKQTQVQCWIDPDLGNTVARRMFARRFGKEPDPDKDIDQLRGLEGVRVRELYKVHAKQAGILWKGRRYDPADFHASDTPNKALTAANACLYAVTEAAVRTAGYDPTLGFLHRGSQTAFVQDIADLYKFQVSVPVAFRVAREGDKKVSDRVRRASRDAFRQHDLVDHIIKDLPTLFEGLT